MNLSRNINLFHKIRGHILNQRSASNVAKDQFHQPDHTPEELNLIAKRMRIRKALRAEYLRKITDPHSTDPIIFDPCMQRYYSMHMTTYERFVPTFKNWLQYMLTAILPVVLLGLYLKYDKRKFERKCRSGELPYEKRLWKLI